MMNGLLRSDTDRTLADIDRRMRVALSTAAQAAGPKAQALMQAALSSGPSPGGAQEASRYFGGDLAHVIDTLSPMLVVMNRGMPGFSEWLERTGYGNDLTMIRALWAWVESDPEMGAVAVRMRHGIKGLH